jgi:hypothetical protein
MSCSMGLTALCGLFLRSDSGSLQGGGLNTADFIKSFEAFRAIKQSVDPVLHLLATVRYGTHGEVPCRNPHCRQHAGGGFLASYFENHRFPCDIDRMDDCAVSDGGHFVRYSPDRISPSRQSAVDRRSAVGLHHLESGRDRF